MNQHKSEDGKEGSEFLYKDLSYAIIGAAMEVHKQLGPGFLESVYQAALAFELELKGISFEQQVELIVCYKGKEVGSFRADFFVEKKIIVEIKATHNLTENDESQLMHYLHCTGFRVGLLINFGTPSLQRIRRIV